jgi:diadenosine tetraphosphatase ApaH/serine/threonine PP2A family protein phosphatase
VRYGILSDIHGNIDALDAIVAVIEDHGVEGWICLGDLVGYGAEPQAVIDRVRALDAATVRGNHDHAAIDPSLDASFNVWAAKAIAWTREHIAPDSLEYLSQLALTERVDGALIVHAAPSDPIRWPYILDAAAAEFELGEFDEQLCLFGHTHSPLSYVGGHGTGPTKNGTTVRYDDGARAIVNVGSVGQPRDGDPSAAAGILDTSERSVLFVRTTYDVQAAADRITAAGLPPLLADRLFEGR